MKTRFAMSSPSVRNCIEMQANEYPDIRQQLIPLTQELTEYSLNYATRTEVLIF